MSIDYSGLKEKFGDNLPEPHTFFATEDNRVGTYQSLRKGLQMSTSNTNRKVWKAFILNFLNSPPLIIERVDADPPSAFSASKLARFAIIAKTPEDAKNVVMTLKNDPTKGHRFQPSVQDSSLPGNANLAGYDRTLFVEFPNVAAGAEWAVDGDYTFVFTFPSGKVIERTLHFSTDGNKWWTTVSILPQNVVLEVGKTAHLVFTLDPPDSRLGGGIDTWAENSTGTRQTTIYFRDRLDYIAATAAAKPGTYTIKTRRGDGVVATLGTVTVVPVAG